MTTIDFVALAKPFSTSAVKTKTVKWQDKKTKEWKQYSASYITARHVMNRLDTVCGPANWRTEFSNDGLPPKSIRCTLFLRVDGEWIGKADVGTVTDIEPEKGMVSDALKRAAVHWGIARELYREGTADLSDSEPSDPPANDSGNTPETVPDDELSAHFPDMTEAQILAGDTFPFDAAWKTKGFDVLRKKKPSWNKVFWAALDDLEIFEDDVHEVAAVDSMNHYNGKVGDLWLALCERKLENAKGD